MPVNICNSNVVSQHYTELYLFDINKYHQDLPHTLRKEVLSLPIGNEELYLKLLPEDIKVKSVFKDNNAFGNYNVSVSFTIIDSSNAVRDILDALTKKRLIIVLQNQIFKTVIGNQLESFSLKYTEKKPTKQSDDTVYLVSMKGVTITPIVDKFEPGQTPPPPASTVCEWTIIHN